MFPLPSGQQDLCILAGLLTKLKQIEFKIESNGREQIKTAVWVDRILAQIAGLGNSYVNLLPFPTAYATRCPAPDAQPPQKEHSLKEAPLPARRSGSGLTRPSSGGKSHSELDRHTVSFRGEMFPCGSQQHPQNEFFPPSGQGQPLTQGWPRVNEVFSALGLPQYSPSDLHPIPRV